MGRDDQTPGARIALLWRGDVAAPPPSPSETRFRRIFEEFSARGALAEPAIYAEEAHDRVRGQLLGMDGVLVWVDPIVGGRERGRLDGLLRELGARGIFVSAHPDVIDKMGTKEVLYRTRNMAWGSDTDVYRDVLGLRDGLSRRLREFGTLVVKQNRGSSGHGVWKLEMARAAHPVEASAVRVQPATRGAAIEEMRFGNFLDRCAPYFRAFNGTGCFVAQPYAERLGDGMIRCYMVRDRVAGFGHQMVTALLPPATGASGPPDPPARVYHGPDKAEFQRIKNLLESEWIPEMQRVLSVDSSSLPLVWDADFLLGPKTPDGDDTFVLCEVNVSGVFPIPDETIAPLAEAAIASSLHARRKRSR